MWFDIIDLIVTNDIFQKSQQQLTAKIGCKPNIN